MKKIVALILILLTFLCKPSSYTEREFTEKYISVLSKNRPDIKYTIVSDLNVMAEIKEKTYYHYLDNAYREYRIDPDSFDKIIQAYMSSSIELYEEPQELQGNNIIPVIKPIDYLEEIKKIDADLKVESGIDVIYESYNDSLIIMYVENKETSFSFISKNNLDKAGIPRTKLREVAVKNLKTTVRNIEIKRWDNGIIEVLAGGIFETSLILLPKIWNKNDFKLSGEIVISIPSRGILLLAGSNDERAITALKNISLKSYVEDSYTISPYLFKWNGNKFEKWK